MWQYGVPFLERELSVSMSWAAVLMRVERQHKSGCCIVCKLRASCDQMAVLSVMQVSISTQRMRQRLLLHSKWQTGMRQWPQQGSTGTDQ